jgi:hypothetical protein
VSRNELDQTVEVICGVERYSELASVFLVNLDDHVGLKTAPKTVGQPSKLCGPGRPARWSDSGIRLTHRYHRLFHSALNISDREIPRHNLAGEVYHQTFVLNGEQSARVTNR